MQSYAGAAVLTLIETRLSFCIPSHIQRASLVAQRLKRLPAMQETWVRSLGRKDPLEEEMATRSSTVAWRIPWTEELGGLVQESPGPALGG